MNDFLYARSQMAMSLAFHIVFAVLGMGLPLLMAIAEGMYLRTRKPVYLELCRRWARGTAILFAVGAVSGTVLSFELGLLWPKFMEHAGAIIGMPFSLEGFAFFTEAIFLGVYLYGWKRVSPRVHWLSGVMVAASGAFSGVFVVTANAWMNAPSGFELVNGTFQQIDPIAAMLNPASFHEVLHMLLAAYVATGFLVAAVHAWFLLRDRTNDFHRRALAIALMVACAVTPLQLLSGDLSARRVATLQPAKFAAMEAHYHTQSSAPLIIGGIPDDETMAVTAAIHVPKALSLLAGGGPNAEVVGLDQFPRDEWPNVKLVHWAFDLMVAAGIAMFLVVIWATWLWRRHRRVPDQPLFLKAVIAAGPLGFLAIECGWLVTELGRQPWIIYGIMRTKDAVTPMTNLVIPFTTLTFVYLGLAVIVVHLLRREILRTALGPSNDDASTERFSRGGNGEGKEDNIA